MQLSDGVFVKIRVTSGKDLLQSQPGAWEELKTYRLLFLIMFWPRNLTPGDLSLRNSYEKETRCLMRWFKELLTVVEENAIKSKHSTSERC